MSSQTAACAAGPTSSRRALADATGEPIEYANLAIRGRLLAPILAEQLEPAIALGPTLLSFNGGGNDMLRPGTDMAAIIAATEGALSRIQQAGIEPLLLAGANPTGGLPSGGSVSRKGSELTEAAGAVAARLGVRFSNNWGDTELAGSQYWSIDRLHLAPVGHHRSPRMCSVPSATRPPLTGSPRHHRRRRRQRAISFGTPASTCCPGSGGG